MTKPTKEQLSDPAWWDENANPENKYCYIGEGTSEYFFLDSFSGDLKHYRRVTKRPEAKWVPEVGGVCQIAESSKYLKISYKEGLKVKIYSKFTDDRGVELFSFVSVNGKEGGVAVAECFKPLKTQREELIDIVAASLQKDDQEVTGLCNKSKDMFISGAKEAVNAMLARFDLTEKDGE